MKNSQLAISNFYSNNTTLQHAVSEIKTLYSEADNIVNKIKEKSKALENINLIDIKLDSLWQNSSSLTENINSSQSLKESIIESFLGILSLSNKIPDNYFEDKLLFFNQLLKKCREYFNCCYPNFITTFESLELKAVEFLSKEGFIKLDRRYYADHELEVFFNINRRIVLELCIEYEKFLHRYRCNNDWNYKWDIFSFHSNNFRSYELYKQLINIKYEDDSLIKDEAS